MSPRRPENATDKKSILYLYFNSLHINISTINKLTLAALSATALLGFSACTQTQEVPTTGNTGLTFRTFLGNSTRAAEYTRTIMATDGFNVSAFGNGDLYFTDTAKPESTEDGIWNTQTGSYIWPSYELSFYAYANLGTYGTATLNTTDKKIDLTTPAKVADQKDVIVAFNKGTRAAHETTGVPMYFKHALSQVEVWAKNTSTTAQYTVEVAGVKLARINSKVTFTYPDAATASGTALTAYGTPGTPASFFAGSSAVQTLDGTAKSLMNSANGNFMIIPQTITAWNQPETLADAATDNKGTYLAVLVRIKSKAGAQIYPTATDEFAYAAVPLNINFEAGKKYKITLDFVNGAGFEEPNNATDASETSDKPANVVISDTPVTPETPGKAILGGPIKFTVEVEG